MIEEYLQIRDIQQYVVTYPSDIKRVILYVHGGPGFSSTPLSYLFSEWSTFGNIVFYDQRGAGLTYWKNRKIKSSFEDIILDLKELIMQLKNKFKVDDVLLIGHSWGSIVGDTYVRRYPEDVSAYIGVGQVIDFKRGYFISLKKAKELAIENDDTKSQRKLLQINCSTSHIFQNFSKIVTVLGKYGYAMSMKQTLTQLKKSPLFDYRNLCSLLLANKNNKALLEYLETYAIDKSNTIYSVPYFYILGNLDYQVPHTLATEYMELVHAPKKGIYMIDGASHTPMIDKKDTFNHVVEEILEIISDNLVY